MKMLPSSVVTFLSQSRLPQLSLSNQYVNREILKFLSWLGQYFQTMDLGFPPFKAHPSTCVSITPYKVHRDLFMQAPAVCLLTRKQGHSP